MAVEFGGLNKLGRIARLGTVNRVSKDHQESKAERF
jgi:hypothetical protein